MRRSLAVPAAALAAAALVLAGCAGGRPAASAKTVTTAAPPRPVRQEPPEVKDPNFVLTVNETVPNPDDDGISFTKVFVDGAEAGKTSVGRKSEERSLKLKLAPGNRLIRLEEWDLPGVGEWSRLPDSAQPRERFVRIEDGTIARLDLRFSEDEASSTLTLSREPAPR